jgi:hypothetical protein
LTSPSSAPLWRRGLEVSQQLAICLLGGAVDVPVGL